MDAVRPHVDVVHPGQVPGGEGALLAFQVSVSLVITDADSPAEEPRNRPNAGTKSPLDRPCRYTSGSTSVTFGVFRAHGGKIAEENRFRSPLAGLRSPRRYACR